jgi:hypothetical protein
MSGQASRVTSHTYLLLYSTGERVPQKCCADLRCVRLQKLCEVVYHLGAGKAGDLGLGPS